MGNTQTSQRLAIKNINIKIPISSPHNVGRHPGGCVVGCCPRRWRISFKSEHLSQQIIITLDSSTRPRISGREHPKFRKNQLCYQ